MLQSDGKTLVMIGLRLHLSLSLSLGLSGAYYNVLLRVPDSFYFVLLLPTNLLVIAHAREDVPQLRLGLFGFLSTLRLHYDLQLLLLDTQCRTLLCFLLIFLVSNSQPIISFSLPHLTRGPHNFF